MGAHIDLSYVMPFVVNTELGSRAGRGARACSNLEPADVADAIVEALQHGDRRRVGAEVGQAHVAARRRCCRARSRRAWRGAIKADRVLAGADVNARAATTSCARALGAGLPPAPERPARAGGPDGTAQSPPALDARRHSALREPVGDQCADQRALVLLQEVRGVLDHARRRRGRSTRRSARPTDSGSTGSESAHSISVGRRSSRSASSTRCPGGGAGRVGGLGDQQREGARAGLGGGVG